MDGRNVGAYNFELTFEEPFWKQGLRVAYVHC